MFYQQAENYLNTIKILFAIYKWMRPSFLVDKNSKTTQTTDYIQSFPTFQEEWRWGHYLKTSIRFLPFVTIAMQVIFYEKLI